MSDLSGLVARYRKAVVAYASTVATLALGAALAGQDLTDYKVWVAIVLAAGIPGSAVAVSPANRIRVAVAGKTPDEIIAAVHDVIEPAVVEAIDEGRAVFDSSGHYAQPDPPGRHTAE